MKRLIFATAFAHAMQKSNSNSGNNKGSESQPPTKPDVTAAPSLDLAKIDLSKLSLKELQEVTARIKAQQKEAADKVKAAAKAAKDAEAAAKAKEETEKYRKLLAGFDKVQVNLRGQGLKADGKDYWLQVEDSTISDAIKAFLTAKVAAADKAAAADAKAA